MAYIPKDVVKEKRTQVIVNQEGTMETTYYFEYDKMVRSDIKYLSGYTSAEEDLAILNKGLPKTKRKYLDEENRLISYFTAKKKGLL